MLIRSRRHFKIPFDQTSFAIQVVTKDGRTSQVSQPWLALWQLADGDDLEDYILSSEWNIFTDVQLADKGVTAIVRRAFAGESLQIPPFLYDAAQLGWFGRARWVSGYAHPIFDEAGSVQEVMLMYEDVGERIRSTSTTGLIEQRYRSLIQGTGQLVWTTSAEGAVEEDSETWRDFTGQTYEEWRSYGWLNVIHPDDQQKTFKLWADSITNRYMYEAVYRLQRLDGEYRWNIGRAVPVLNDDGSIREWVGINFDVHALKTNQSQTMGACS